MLKTAQAYMLIIYFYCVLPELQLTCKIINKPVFCFCKIGKKRIENWYNQQSKVDYGTFQSINYRLSIKWKREEWMVLMEKNGKEINWKLTEYRRVKGFANPQIKV